MNAFGIVIIIAYLLSFFIYNGLYSIKKKIDNQQFFYDKKEKIITSALAIVFIFIFFHDWRIYKIDKAYQYITDHPLSYQNYLELKLQKRQKHLHTIIDKINSGKYDPSKSTMRYGIEIPGRPKEDVISGYERELEWLTIENYKIDNVITRMLENNNYGLDDKEDYSYE